MQRLAVVITRPGETGRELARDVEQAGFETVWWPAFDIVLAPSEPARAALARLPAFDCVVFVSAAAVAAVAGMRGDTAWPPAVAVAAVGGATAAAARAALNLPADVRLIAPADSGEGESGSEALWPLLAAAAPRRVLIARAQHGREWLAEQLLATGAQVTSTAVYERRPRPLLPAQRAQLLRWQADGVRTVVVFTSSEAADLMCGPADDSAGALIRSGSAVATHPRIAERLRQLGAASVQLASSSASGALIDCFRSLEFQTS